MSPAVAILSTTAVAAAFAATYFLREGAPSEQKLYGYACVGYVLSLALAVGSMVIH